MKEDRGAAEDTRGLQEESCLERSRFGRRRRGQQMSSQDTAQPARRSWVELERGLLSCGAQSRQA
jgi:hypothetical protein